MGEPQQTVHIPEDPKDYFEVTPVDAEGNVVEGVRGLMHPDVLKYMEDNEPRKEGGYLFFTNYGRLGFTLN